MVVDVYLDELVRLLGVVSYALSVMLSWVSFFKSEYRRPVKQRKQNRSRAIFSECRRSSTSISQLSSSHVRYTSALLLSIPLRRTSKKRR